MEASRVSSERRPESELATASPLAQQPGAEAANDVVRQIVRTYGNDAESIAAGLEASGRTNDREVWMALQRTVGNATTVQVRQLVEQGAAQAGAEQAEPRSEGPPEQQRVRVVHGVRILNSPGASADAVDACAEFITQLVGENEYAQRKFERQRVTIVIIPANTRMTDLPQFARLRGRQTFDGRAWDDVRGSGGMRAPDGSWAVGVSEENLADVESSLGTSYGEFGLGMHELAHTLQSKGLTRRQRRKLERLYREHRQRDPDNRLRSWTDNYAAENSQEYFAQSTNCFFGNNSLPGNNNGREWLAANDRPMYEFLIELYERPHDRRGRVREDESDQESAA